MHTELFVKLLERVQIDLNDLKMVISIKNASDTLQLWKKKTIENTSINLHRNNFFYYNKKVAKNRQGIFAST